VDATSTTGGTNYTASVIASLPVDRDYADIVRANPGVDADQGPTQGRGIALTIYGATSAENQWIVDGVNTTNVRTGQQGRFFNMEFVQEVEVKTDGYGAEHGGAPGGLINVVTRSERREARSRA
jgi:outer membrane cobalamin receptor